MSGKFDRFTRRARQALSMAQQEARNMNHGYIGTEHLLLGLLREEEGIASRVLMDMGLSVGRARRVVQSIVGSGEQHSASLQLANQTKEVIQLAIEEAKKLNHNYIGTEHLLLALLRNRDSVAAAVLRSLKINDDVVRRRVLNLMRQSANSPSIPRERSQTKGQSVLDKLSVDLTDLARHGELDPVIGRLQEIERVIQILARRTKNNPALIGDPGVGKTAIVEGLAQRIVAGQVPPDLQTKRLVRLDVGSLVAGTMYRGQFEERLKRVIDEITSTDTMLFIDELHMLVGAGSAGNSVDAANILKPALARGELQCIGATTLDEYRKHIEGDAALERRFQPVFVDEPTIEETIDILHGIRSRYEEHHHLKITDEALEAAARLAVRYVSDRYLPDKAIDLVDEAASRVRVFKVLHPDKISGLIGGPSTNQDSAKSADQDAMVPSTANMRDELQFISDQLGFETMISEHPSGLRVTEEDIAEIVSMWTGIPAARVAEQESERLLRMEEALHKRIVSQDEAIKVLSRTIRRARAGLKDPNRPIGSLIFLGPTGVGKTELCKALAEFMFGSEEALLQLDMSEFMERHTVSRLVGAPPGYVGYEEAGQLTEAIRRRPYSVVCFDEVEKAHHEAFNILLQIMEEGQLSDAKGRVVDFRNTVVIMTSNVGSSVITRDSAIGFSNLARQDAKTEYEEMKSKAMGELKKLFRPEFLNRVDEIVVFHELTREDIRNIVEMQIARVNERLVEHDMRVECTEAGAELLANEGYDPKFGARPLRRAVQRLVEDPLAEKILEKVFGPGDVVLIDAKEGEIVLENAEALDEPAALLSGEQH
ncbi:MAG: ATP-dependent Clp protease ATP-binding subunit [Chloroflexota bacterium]|nr:ATP-dependent Clp protease ATP-binding subunit [Chloroflexota bacterium]